MKVNNPILKLVWHRLSKNTIAFLLGCLFIMVLDTYLVKGWDSSFTSALMDTVMAAAAVAALLKAGEYIKQKLHEDSYKYALSLLNEFVPKMFDLLSVRHTIGNLKTSISSHSDFVKNRVEIEGLKCSGETIFDFHKDVYDFFITQLYPLNQEIKFTIFRMRNTNGDFKNDIDGTFLYEYFSNYSEAVERLEVVLSEIKRKLLFFKKIEGKGGENGYINLEEYAQVFNEPFTTRIDKEISEVLGLIQKVTQGIDKITQNRKDLTAYFVFGGNNKQ